VHQNTNIVGSDQDDLWGRSAAAPLAVRAPKAFRNPALRANLAEHTLSVPSIRHLIWQNQNKNLLL
jgi:hypothetical protein